MALTACGCGAEECPRRDRSLLEGAGLNLETGVTDEEYMAHENALTAQWIGLLDAFANLPAHRLQAIVRMLEHHTDQLAGILRPRLLFPSVEE
jgi:hypothetical protein